MSDHRNSQSAGREGAAPYETQPRKNRTGLWIGLGAAALFILLLGTCVWTFSGLWTDSLDRQSATQDFIAKVYANGGLPQAGDPAYHPQFGATQQQIDDVNAMAERFGDPVETGETVCLTAVSANTDPVQNGKRSECSTPMKFEGTEGTVTVIWKKDGDLWKLLYFHLYFNDPSAADRTPSAGSDADPADSPAEDSPD